MSLDSPDTTDETLAPGDGVPFDPAAGREVSGTAALAKTLV